MMDVNLNINIGVNGGMMVLGVILMVIAALLDYAVGFGTFWVVFYCGLASLIIGFILKGFGVAD